MRNARKVIALLLCVVSVMAIFAGCGSKKVETNPDGTAAVQSKKAVVAYNSSGYGNSWLKVAAEKFMEMYKDEGYEIELKISYSYEVDAGLEIGKGADKNDVDLYIDAQNLETLLDASDKTMRGQGAVLVDLKEEVWNKPAIGLNKQEETKTVKERFLLDENYIYYDGKKEEFHGGIYCLPYTMPSCGIIVNPAVLAQYGYTTDNLPKTTDEFNAMCEKIAAASSQTGIYAYSWPGGNAAGYITYLFFEYFAQYSGREAFFNFVETKPTTDATLEEIKADGWKVYEDKGILEAIKAMEPIMEPRFSPNGSASMDHMTAQDYMLTGKAAFMMDGAWLLNEMEEEYYDEAAQCLMMNTPVLSVIGTEAGITDAELSKAVGMIDEGKTNAEIIAAIPGLDDAETQRIRDARNIYGCGEAVVRSGFAVPAYADGRDVAILFIRFLLSEDGCKILRDEAFHIAGYECASYESVGNTPFMDSVIANINPGHGKYISMDVSLSIVRANSGMLYFNHPNLVQPITFKNMILDTTGDLTAQKMYEMEKEYAKSNWSTWTAYIN